MDFLMAAVAVVVVVGGGGAVVAVFVVAVALAVAVVVVVTVTVAVDVVCVASSFWQFKTMAKQQIELVDRRIEEYPFSLDDLFVLRDDFLMSLSNVQCNI